MKALTLTQPWATLVAESVKVVETRDWACPNWQIGQWLAIHAGKSFGGLQGTPWPATANGLRQACHAEPFYSALAEKGYLLTTQLGLTDEPPIDMLRIPTGAVVAVARVAGCQPTEVAGPALEAAAADDPRWARELELGGYGPERFAWKLNPIVKLAHPIPCSGERQLWDLPPAVEHALRDLFAE